MLAKVHNDALHYIQRINPEHERSEKTKEINGNTYGKLCQIAKTTRYNLSSQDVLPYRLRKDQLEKLNYFLKRIREDTFTVGDYEDLFTNENLLKALLAPEETSDLVQCIDIINIKKLLLRGTPAQPNPVQTKDKQGRREIDEKGSSRLLTPVELSEVRSKFKDETTPHKTIQPDQVVRKQRLDLENTMDQTFTTISGLLIKVLSNQSTTNLAPSLKPEYDILLHKFKEILSDKNKARITTELKTKHYFQPKDLRLTVMVENRIRFSLQHLNIDLKDLERRIKEISLTKVTSDKPQRG